MAWKKKAETPRKPRKIAPRAPQDVERALSLLHLERPLHVPESATLLVAWVDLPNENKQRTQRFAAWKDQVKDHFSRCLAAQPHPGLIDDPMVYIRLDVAGVGDERNRASRAKYIIDRLQVRRETTMKTAKGKVVPRVTGLADLITDDRILNAENCVIDEFRTPIDQENKVNPRKVMVWVWRRDAA